MRRPSRIEPQKASVAGVSDTEACVCEERKEAHGSLAIGYFLSNAFGLAQVRAHLRLWSLA